MQVLERTRDHLGELAVEEGEMRGRQVFRANMLQHMAGRKEVAEEEEEEKGLHHMASREDQAGGGDSPSGEHGPICRLRPLNAELSSWLFGKEGALPDVQGLTYQRNIWC